MALLQRLPGFRTTCLVVCGLYVLLGGSILARGVEASLAPFGVPAETMASPHFADAIWWTYSHMVVIGLMIGALGLFAESARLKRNMSRLLFAANAYYTYLDVRSSDTALGNGLYEGPASIAPAIVAGVVTLLFLQLSLRDHGTEETRS